MTEIVVFFFPYNSTEMQRCWCFGPPEELRSPPTLAFRLLVLVWGGEAGVRGPAECVGSWSRLTVLGDAPGHYTPPLTPAGTLR